MKTLLTQQNHIADVVNEIITLVKARRKQHEAVFGKHGPSDLLHELAILEGKQLDAAVYALKKCKLALREACDSIRVIGQDTTDLLPPG
jgi:hypothetical protein